MAAISREDVAHLARLSRLAVTEQELDRFAGQLDVILQSVARVGEVAADDIPRIREEFACGGAFLKEDAAGVVHHESGGDQQWIG